MTALRACAKRRHFYQQIQIIASCATSMIASRFFNQLTSFLSSKTAMHFHRLTFQRHAEVSSSGEGAVPCVSFRACQEINNMKMVRHPVTLITSSGVSDSQNVKHVHTDFIFCCIEQRPKSKDLKALFQRFGQSPTSLLLFVQDHATCGNLLMLNSRADSIVYLLSCVLTKPAMSIRVPIAVYEQEFFKG